MSNAKRGGTLQGPGLDPADARALMDVFRGEAGLSFTEESTYVLERRLRERVVALGLASFAPYVELLRSPGGQRELEEALELVTTHETYFFREEYQLRAFSEQVLPKLKATADGRRRLGIWSAGCSTGEEAYTVAMLLRQSGLFDDPWELRVLGTDLSRRCVNSARRAVYGRAAFRAVPPEYRNGYFIDEPEGTRVAPEIRAMCTFAQMNLLHPERAATVVGRMDAIFCRNVLIYLDAEARMRVLEVLYDRLAPGGYLMLGHSESLLNVSSSFEVVHLREDLVYRRPERDGGARFRVDSR